MNTHTGKIARLPMDIRDELNRRLDDGHSATIILPWLNQHPEVQTVLAARFAGQPVSPQNLSQWRRTGYRDWRHQQRDLAKYEKAGQFIAEMSNGGCDQLARGAMAAASTGLFKFLVDDPDAKYSVKDVVKITSAAANLLHAQQNDSRLEIARERLRQQNDESPHKAVGPNGHSSQIIANHTKSQ